MTVIVPCHNDGALLREAVDSLHEQEPCAVIVVDDGSDDAETARTLRELAAAGVTVLRIPNSGPSAARNLGLLCSETRYVFPLDADDVLVPGALAALADALDADPEAGLAWGDEETFGSEVVYRRSLPALDPWRLSYVNEIPDAMIRREAAVSVGGWDEADVGYEDWDMWLSLVESGAGGVYVPRLVCRYRLHGSRRLSGRSVKRHDEIMAHFRRRHPALYAARRRNRRRSEAPRRMKLLFPVVDRVPFVSGYGRQRLLNFTAHPRRLLRQRIHRALAPVVAARHVD